MPVDKFGRTPSVGYEAPSGVSIRYVNSNFLRRDGTSTTTGPLNMNNNRISNVVDPMDGQDAANMSYVDDQTIDKLRKTGDVMSGKLDMGGKKIVNVEQPTDDNDVATKGYVDVRKPIIAIWAEERGQTTDGEYEWSFGNGSDGQDHRWLGYTMPVSGRIIKGSLTAVMAKPYISQTGRVVVNVVINGTERTEYSIIKDSDKWSDYVSFATPLELRAGDRVNFISRTTNPSVAGSVATALIELDI